MSDSQKSGIKDFVKLSIAFMLSISLLGLIGISFFKFIFSGNIYPPTTENKQPELETSTLTIGILSKPTYYQELITYLREQFGNKVQIVLDGDENLSYEKARQRMINKEWDIAFTLSPILSVAAKNNDYRFVGRMFPDFPPYYQATLFTKANSPIKSISDLKPTHTIAMGDFNSASSFYVASYDLYGKILKVNMGHKSSKIKELVKTGQADVGAAADSAVKNDKDLRIIHISKQIPGANVYLSPKLSESDRQIITTVLLNAPEDIKKQANYGSGDEYDYSQLIKISQRTEEILGCANFQQNPVNFYCKAESISQKYNTSNNTSTISGQINGWSRKSAEIESFKLAGEDKNNYLIVIPRKILDQVPGASNPIALQRKQVKIFDVVPQRKGAILELQITNPNQLTVLEQN